ncbi:MULTISPECIES: SRPBCC domain-containing protein [Acinetobacter]|uniref:SRPBCC domain-containing protein n=1 Tax=Acinetobacter TaxID=469 RepID=UPI00054D2950|nr:MULTISPECIES: SRPBCC domain-containing protein [Acinetobacter]MBM7139273.1 SRPBCC domain-containing protein [Acinetobacter sp. 105-3]
MKLILTIVVFSVFIFLFRHERIETKIVINQPIDHVWQAFTCTSSYPKWNTLFGIDRFPTHVDQQITVDLYKENRNVQFTMRPVIKKLEKYHLEWEGKLYINGLFNGRHQFIFTKINANTTQLVQAEDFNGLLVPILNYFVIQPTQFNFDKMNRSFKKYTEDQTLNNDICKIS